MKRDFDPATPELMDHPETVSGDFERTLRNLATINRHFGGHRLLRRFLSAWLSPGRTYRVLDLCTGSGDLPRAMVTWGRAHQISIRVDALDANETTLAVARGLSAGFAEIDFVSGDALTFESPLSYDLVVCSLALHHFSDEQAAHLLRRCHTLSHRFVLVADLERGFATTLGIQLLTGLFFRERITRHDGLLSARRAFSFAEFRALADAAGWSQYGHARFLFCRQALWLDGREVGDIPLTDTAALPCPT